MSPAVAQADVAALYRRYGFQIEQRCRRILANPEEARDAAQEVFVRLMTRGETFRGDAEWTTWLYRVATNICLTRLRDHKNRQRLLDHHGEVLEPSPLETPAVTRHRDAIARVAEQVDEALVATAIYYFVDEMAQGEIATLMGVSRVTVNKRLQKFKERARDVLAGDGVAA